MKATFPLLLLLSFPCLAATETALGILKRDAAVSGQKLVWDLDMDFQLSEKQVSEAGALPKGHTVQLAATLIQMVVDNGQLKGIGSDDVPVALSCPEQIVIVTRQSESKTYLKKGCNPSKR